MASSAKARFEIKIADVQSLLDIHTENSGTGRGRRESKLRVLNKASIAFLVAAWETYIESVVEEAAMFLVTQGLHSLVPSALEPLKRQKLIEDQQELLEKNVQQVTKRFNTADSKNVKQLFLNVLGIEDIRSYWNRQGMDWEEARAALDQLLEERHRIVHGSTDDPEYSKNDVKNWRRFLVSTVNRTDEAVKAHLLSLTGKLPW